MNHDLLKSISQLGVVQYNWMLTFMRIIWVGCDVGKIKPSCSVVWLFSIWPSIDVLSPNCVNPLYVNQ